MSEYLRFINWLGARINTGEIDNEEMSKQLKEFYRAHHELDPDTQINTHRSAISAEKEGPVIHIRRLGAKILPAPHSE